MTMRDFYIHGSDSKEQERLSRLNRLINDASLAELALSAGQRVLDVGSGLGQFTRDMARAVGGGSRRVLAIERDPAQMAEARRQAEAAGEGTLVEWRQGDATSLPLEGGEWGAFDLAHSRFLLEHVPDPGAVVRAMVRAVRPGGRIVLADDDHDLLRLHPEPPLVMDAWRAYFESYRAAGNDPFIGRRLVSLIHDAGGLPRRNTWVFFGSCSGHADFAPLVSNLARILEGARDAIARGGVLDATDVDRAVGSLEAWGLRPDAALWYGISWAEGVKPPDR
jgi:SAM-dependent methyltransferase